MIAFIKFLWALPLSLLGWGVVLLNETTRILGVINIDTGKVRVYGYNGVPWVYSVNAWVYSVNGGLLYWIFQKTGFAGLTLGQVILFRWDVDTWERLMAHEEAHVRQMERWGIIFPFLYVGEFLFHFVRTRNWMKAYYSISWEKKAREAEER